GAALAVTRRAGLAGQARGATAGTGSTAAAPGVHRLRGRAVALHRRTGAIRRAGERLDAQASGPPRRGVALKAKAARGTILTDRAECGGARDREDLRPDTRGVGCTGVGCCQAGTSADRRADARG